MSRLLLPMIAAYLLLGAATFLICLFASRIGTWLGVMDAPDGERKAHKRPTPLVGGLAVMAPVCAVAVIQAATTDFKPFYTAIAAAIAASMLLGFADDRKHLRPTWRLLIGVAIGLAVIVAVPALEVSFLEFSFVPVALFFDGWLGTIFTLLCLVGLQNAVNNADGRNGLVIGMSLIWCLLLFAYAPAHLYPLLSVLAVGLAICLGFNIRGRLFLGDCGAYSLGVTVGLLAIYCYYVNFAIMPADLVALMFLVPIVDFLRVILLRVVEGRSPLRSGGNHLHHILEWLMPWDRALPVYLAMVALPSLLAMAWPGKTLLWGVIALSSYAAVIGVGYRYRSVVSQRGTAAYG